jgi:hypothetical protein
VSDVLSGIAIVPSPPVLVPELAAGAAGELAEVRQAAVAAAASLPPRWLAVGVGPGDEVIAPSRVGTFAGYGVDVPVRLSPQADEPPTALPLCALVTGWLRGQVDGETHAEVRVFADTHSAESALAHGRRLRGELDATAGEVGVLIVADGAHTLTQSAPGGYDPASAPVQAALDDALAGGDTAALAVLPDLVVGRVAYQVLAGLVGPGPRSVTELYRGAPFGVGYFVGRWQP